MQSFLEKQRQGGAPALLLPKLLRSLGGSRCCLPWCSAVPSVAWPGSTPAARLCGCTWGTAAPRQPLGAPGSSWLVWCPTSGELQPRLPSAGGIQQPPPAAGRRMLLHPQGRRKARSPALTPLSEKPQHGWAPVGAATTATCWESSWRSRQRRAAGGGLQGRR